MYATTITLNVALLIIGLINFCISVVLFYLVRKIGKYERDKMLPLSVLNLHAKEYSEDYKKMLKEIIGNNEREVNAHQNNMYDVNNPENAQNLDKDDNINTNTPKI